MTTLAIVQARMGSARLPGKVMRTVAGVPLIELLLQRLRGATSVDRIVLATSERAENEPLARHVTGLGIDVFRGSESDVLDRFYRAAAVYRPAAVVRVTGDCPLVDPALVDAVVERYHAAGANYVSNTHPPTFPDGLDVEVFSFDALAKAAAVADRPFDREHVTPFLRESGLFDVANVAGDEDYSAERWTVDETEDLDVVTAVFEFFAPRIDFGWREVLALRHARPDLFATNRGIARNEGAVLTQAQKMQRRAERRDAKTV